MHKTAVYVLKCFKKDVSVLQIRPTNRRCSGLRKCIKCSKLNINYLKPEFEPLSEIYLCP